MRYGHFLWQRYRNSPTLTTYSSLAARSLNLTVVLPLALQRLPGSEAAVWLLISTVISFKTIFDSGFNPSFSRLFAFAMGGLDDLSKAKFDNGQTTGCQEANWNLVKRIFPTMNFTYSCLAGLAMLALITAGSWALQRPISELSEPREGWMAWGCVCIAFPIIFWGSHYNAFLEGTNHIAVLRRWDSLLQLFGCFVLIACLLFAPSLLWLTLGSYIVQLVSVWINRQLFIRVRKKFALSIPIWRVDKEVLLAVWPTSWRTGLGVALTSGLLNATGFIYAQSSQAASLVTYLFSLRSISGIGQFCQAPFYSKIPILARLRSQGAIVRLKEVAQRGMALTYATYALSVCTAGWVFAALSHHNTIFCLTDSHAIILWFMLAIAVFVERYGALHIQLFSTTNRIVVHIANGISGLLILLFLIILLPVVGVLAFPLSFILGYSAFYCWYSAMLSYRSLAETFWNFERQTFFLFWLLFLLGNLLIGLIRCKYSRFAHFF